MYDSPRDGAIVFVPSGLGYCRVNLVSYLNEDMPRKFNFDLGICNGRFDGTLLEIPETWNSFNMVSKINTERPRKPGQLDQLLDRVDQYERRGVATSGVVEYLLNAFNRED